MKLVKELEAGKEMEYLQTFTTETSILIPNPLGVALSYNGSYSHVLRLSAGMKLTGNPFAKSNKDQLKFDVNLRPRYNDKHNK